MLWGASTAAATRPSTFNAVVWSPCNRFIAITREKDGVVVLDSATLQRLQTLRLPQGIPLGSEALSFSPDSRILTCSSYDYIDPPDGELYVVSWDLQTGGVASIIEWRGPVQGDAAVPSTIYSANRKMVGVSPTFHSFSEDSDIFICDVASGVLMHSHLPNNIVPLSNLIWTHGESFRFATADSTTITIWEVRFISGVTPTEVETLPAPDGFDHECETVQLLPAPCRLALVSQNSDQILVWDARNSRYLLECKGAEFYGQMSFSSDGLFFACPTTRFDIYLWKESPAGYILHRILVSNTMLSTPLLTRNGKSIATFGGRMIQLWRTGSSNTPGPSSISTQVPRSTDEFILEFSPGGTLAVFARQRGNVVTVFNLKFGVPQLTIDASMKVYGLGVIGDSLVVMGNRNIVIRDLPAGDCTPSARVCLEDGSSTVQLRNPLDDDVIGVSISPDFRHIALSYPGFLRIHSGSTGELLWTKSISVRRRSAFSPDGRDLWCVDNQGRVEVRRVGDEREALERLERTIDIQHPPEGYPWASSRGYRVTNDWWILGPDGKRLLLLPPPWQSYAIGRRWKGQFLTLLHQGLSEPVILDLDVNRDL